jgi:hypothetical protein
MCIPWLAAYIVFWVLEHVIRVHASGWRTLWVGDGFAIFAAVLYRLAFKPNRADVVDKKNSYTRNPGMSGTGQGLGCARDPGIPVFLVFPGAG